jgi:hypothetical protein
MSRAKRSLRTRLLHAGVGLVALLGVGTGITGAAVLTAPIASADTYSDCYNLSYGAECYVHVTWFEYWFLGENDHWDYFPGWYAA